MTDKIHAYELMRDVEKDRKNLLFDTHIHFIAWSVSRSRSDEIGGRVQYSYPVTIRYYLEALPGESQPNTILDNLEAIDSLVNTALGRQWQGTVDYWQGQTDPYALQQEIIAEKQVWVSEYVYTGVKSTSLS